MEQPMTRQDDIAFWEDWVEKYPIPAIPDNLTDSQEEAWLQATVAWGRRVFSLQQMLRTQTGIAKHADGGTIRWDQKIHSEESFYGQ